MNALIGSCSPGRLEVPDALSVLKVFSSPQWFKVIQWFNGLSIEPLRG